MDFLPNKRIFPRRHKTNETRIHEVFMEALEKDKLKGENNEIIHSRTGIPPRTLSTIIGKDFGKAAARNIGTLESISKYTGVPIWEFLHKIEQETYRQTHPWFNQTIEKEKTEVDLVEEILDEKLEKLVNDFAKILPDLAEHISGRKAALTIQIDNLKITQIATGVFFSPEMIADRSVRIDAALIDASQSEALSLRQATSFYMPPNIFRKFVENAQRGDPLMISLKHLFSISAILGNYPSEIIKNGSPLKPYLIELEQKARSNK